MADTMADPFFKTNNGSDIDELSAFFKIKPQKLVKRKNISHTTVLQKYQKICDLKF